MSLQNTHGNCPDDLRMVADATVRSNHTFEDVLKVANRILYEAADYIEELHESIAILKESLIEQKRDRDG